MAELSARLGAGFIRREARDGPGSLSMFGVGYLLGWGLLGLAYLGLSLTGLFYRPIIILLPLLLLAFSPAARMRRFLAVDAVRAWGLAGWVGISAVFAAFFPVIPHLLVPESEQDSYSYHLGAPWQFLVSHRALLGSVFMDFHLPIPVEITFALPLSLGFERLARWIVLTHFLAAVSVWAGWCLGRGMKTAAWLGLVLPLSLAYLPWNLTTTKNDVAAASLVVAGSIMLLRGRRFTAAALFGMGISAKAVVGPVVALLLLAGPRPFASPCRIFILLALPVLGWWIKTFIATGNPFFPLATGFIPTFDWDTRNSQVYSAYITPLNAPDTLSWKGLPVAVFRHLFHDNPLTVLLLPVLFLVPGRRRIAVSLLVAAALLLRAGHATRFLMPVSWLLLSLAVAEFWGPPGTGPLSLRGLSEWRKGILAGILAVWAVSRIFMNPLVWPAPWQDAQSAFHDALEDRLVTFGDAVRVLGELKPGRVLTMGELSTYRIPSRVISTGSLGSIPLMWKIVKESRSEDDIARRVCQLGNPLILHNIVGSIWKGYRYQSFKWDRRMLSLYHGFSRKRLDLARAPERFDTGRGIYYIYRLHRTPRARMYHPVAGHFLPGVANVLAETRRLRNAGKTDEMLAEARQLLELLPGLGVIRSEIAFALYSAGRHAEAYKILKPMMETGVIDTKNLITFGSVAIEVGDFESAGRVFDWALGHYPSVQPHLKVDRAEVWWRQGRHELRSGDRAGAKRSAEKAASLLANVFPTRIVEVEKYRMIGLAQIAGLRGDLARTAGKRGEAAVFYREALSYGVDVPESKGWRKVLKSLE